MRPISLAQELRVELSLTIDRVTTSPVVMRCYAIHKREQMKAKAVVIHSNKVLVQAFIVAAFAFLFSNYANAVTLKASASKKSVKTVVGPVDTALATSLESQAKARSNLVYGAALSAGINQTNTSEGRQSYYGTYSIRPSVAHAKTNTSLDASLTYDRQYSYALDDRTDGDWRSVIVKLNKKISVSGLVDNVTVGPRLWIGLGNEARRQTFQGALGAAVSVDKKIGVVTLGQTAAYLYRQFEYDIRNDGTVNSPHSLSESTSLTFSPTDWLHLGASFGLSYLRSFQGVSRTFSTTDIGASFSLAKNVSLSIGATTFLKSTLEPSGSGNKVKIWDSNDAIAFMELGLSI